MIGLGFNLAGSVMTGQVQTRLIPTLAGSQYGTIDTPISFAGDFEVEVEFASTDATLTGTGLFGNSILAGAVNYFQVKNGAGNADFQTIDGITSWAHGDTHLDGKIHTLTAYRSGLTIGIKLDGVVKSSDLLGAASNITIDVIGALGVTSVIQQFFNGQILSTKFTDAGTVVANFVFDSGSDTDQPSRGGGNNVSLVNFATTDWNRYTQQRNIVHDGGTIFEAWVGDNLVVNGTFDTDTDWTKGTGWSIGSGVGTGASGTASALKQNAGTISGDIYLSEIGVSGYSAGNVYSHVGSQNGTALSANGSYTEIITDGGTATDTGAWKDLNFVGDVDNIVVKKLLEVA